MQFRFWLSILYENRYKLLLKRVPNDERSPGLSGTRDDDSSPGSPGTAGYIKSKLLVILVSSILILVSLFSFSQQAKPTRQQIQWHEMEFICLYILDPIHLLEKNGGMVMSWRMFLIQLKWIAGNGQELLKHPVQKELLSPQNIMMVFVYGQVIFLNILFGKAIGKTGKAMCLENYLMLVKKLD